MDVQCYEAGQPDGGCIVVRQWPENLKPSSGNQKVKIKMRSYNYNLVKYSIGLAAAGSVLLGGRVMADVVSYSADYGSAGSPLSVPGSATLSLDKFNTALGVLNEVFITLTSHDVVSVNIENNNLTSQNYSAATAALPVTVTALAGLTTTATGTAAFGGGTVVAASQFNFGPPFGIVTFPSNTTLPGQSVDASNSASLSSGFAAYEGSSGQTFNVTVAPASGNYTGSAGPGVDFGGAGTSYGTIKVEYDYTPVAAPEPSALLGGFGAMGTLAMLAWRQRK